MAQSDDSLLALAARIVIAHIEHNETPARVLPVLIRNVYQALADAGTNAPPPPTKTGARMPGLARRETVFNDHLICMECGLKMKMLKRHLQTVHNMTPALYRMKWHLPHDYPMVAQQYAALRSSLAKESGLGKRHAPRGRYDQN